jgi:hypothetical protein
MVGFYNNNDDLSKLQRGLICNKLFIYSKTNYLYVVKDDIRMFYVSFKRLKKTIRYSLNDIFSIIVKNPNNVYLESKLDNPSKFILIIKHHNTYYNTVFTYKIKVKEINNYLKIIENENPNSIINKQYDKINTLLEKLAYYENKYPEILTDEEFL